MVRARTRAGAFYGTRTILQLLRQPPDDSRGTGTRLAPLPRAGVDGRHRAQARSPCAGWRRTSASWPTSSSTSSTSTSPTMRAGGSPATRHPEVVTRPPLSKRQVRGLVRLAARYHVRVVPEIDMPGHMGAALARHPELQLADTAGRRNPRNLDISLPAARRFARELIEEYLPLFPGRYWHMGADEYLGRRVDRGHLRPLSPAARVRPGTPRAGRERQGRDPLVRRRDRPPGAPTWEDAADVARRHRRRTGRADPAPRGRRVVDRRPGPDADRPARRRPPRAQRGLVSHLLRGRTGREHPSGHALWPTRDGSPTTSSASPPCSARRASRRRASTVRADEPRLLGSELHVWNDDPTGETEDQIAAGIFPRLRVLAQKTWSSRPLTPSFDQLLRISESLGHAPGWR